MNLDELKIETEPDERDVIALRDHLHEFNKRKTSYYNDELIAIFIKTDDREVKAGLFGWTWGGCCEIEFLWVCEELRNRGLGARLLMRAEDEARRRGCHQVILNTHSFQALDFYLKLGYEVFGAVDDFPLGHKNYYLKKLLTTETQR